MHRRRARRRVSFDDMRHSLIQPSKGVEPNQLNVRTDSVPYRKRILILESNGLLAAGVRSMLSERDSLEVVCITLGTAGDLAQIEALQPDVIVVDEAIVAKHIDVYLTLLRNYYHRIRIIVLNPRMNRLDVCDMQVVTVERLSDFLDLI